MIPVIVISLTVDYAIQAISHYREQRIEGLGGCSGDTQGGQAL